MTDRIKKVREKYLTLTVPMETNAYAPKKYKNFGTGDRWLTLGYLRGWEKNKYCRTTLIRASLAEAEELYQSVPQIYDESFLSDICIFPNTPMKSRLNTTDFAPALKCHATHLSADSRENVI